VKNYNVNFVWKSEFKVEQGDGGGFTEETPVTNRPIKGRHVAEDSYQIPEIEERKNEMERKTRKSASTDLTGLVPGRWGRCEKKAMTFQNFVNFEGLKRRSKPQNPFR